MPCSLALFEPSSCWMISRNNVPVTLNHIKTWLTFNFSLLICKNFHLICSKGHWNSIIKRIKISGIICSERDIETRKCWIFLLNEQWEILLGHNGRLTRHVLDLSASMCIVLTCKTEFESVCFLLGIIFHTHFPKLMHQHKISHN